MVLLKWYLFHFIQLIYKINFWKTWSWKSWKLEKKQRKKMEKKLKLIGKWWLTCTFEQLSILVTGKLVLEPREHDRDAVVSTYVHHELHWEMTVKTQLGNDSEDIIGKWQGRRNDSTITWRHTSLTILFLTEIHETPSIDFFIYWRVIGFFLALHLYNILSELQIRNLLSAFSMFTKNLVKTFSQVRKKFGPGVSLQQWVWSSQSAACPDIQLDWYTHL